MCHPSREFAESLAEHRPYLLRMAARRVPDAALAEDLVQETLLAALQGAAPFEARAALRTWLTGILLRRCADQARRTARRGDRFVAPATDPDDAGEEPPAPDAVDWIDPARRLEGREFLAALEGALQDLPATAARLFTLREIDGQAADGAARALGLSARHGAWLLHRTRRRLQGALAAHGPHRIRTEA
ncbi:MAG: sigma-70 family RNA polymerase sigma factor [Piscinibacter sp.]|nr:sigma-70 family RNA polymerase sigma factor [Piscinibacter sp.]